MALLYNNRQYGLVPEKPFEIEIGSYDKPLKSINTSNLTAIGEVKTNRLEINGYVFNIDHLLIPKLGKINYIDQLVSQSISTCNLEVVDLQAESFVGNGDNLTFPGLRNNIIPGSTGVTIGSATDMFAKMFSDTVVARNVTVSDTLAAKFIEGDASRLTNIDYKFNGLNESIIPDSNNVYTIGRRNKRFKEVFTDDLNAVRNMRGKRIVVTNESFDDRIEEIVEEGNQFFVKYDVNEDIMKRLGDKLDIQVDTLVAGVSYTVDAIARFMTVQERLVPQFDGQAMLGTPELRFDQIHTNNLRIYDDLKVDTLDADTIRSSKSISEEYSGNGEFIDNVTHLGEQTSNIVPKFDNDVSLGTAEKRFKEVHADSVIADEIFLRDGGKVSLPVIGKLDLKIGAKYSNYGRMQFQAESISKFAKNIDLENGSFQVTQSGVYHISLFGLGTIERAPGQDVMTRWQIHHFNRTLHITQVIELDRQITHTLFLAELDTITLVLFSTPVDVMTVYQGILSVFRVASMPGLENNFSFLDAE